MDRRLENRLVLRRPYKWGPGVPSLAIRFVDDPPKYKKVEEPYSDPGNVLGTQQYVMISAQNDLLIGVSLP